MGRSFHSVEQLPPPFALVDERAIFLPAGGSLVNDSPYALKLVLLLEGAVRQQLDDAPSFTYRAGDLLIMPRPCRQRITALEPGDERMLALRILFDDAVIEGMRAHARLDPERSFTDFVVHHFREPRLLPDFVDADIRALLQRLRAEAAGIHPGFRHAVAGCLCEITVQAVRRCVLPRASERDQNLSRGELLVQAARDFLHSHFHRNHELVDIAASLGVSPEHLARVFKRLTGQTVLHYREQLRLEQAKALLLSGGQGIAEIAGAVGYASANRFGTRFKAYTGLSPSAFRGRHGTSSHAEPSRIEVIDS